MIEKNLSLPTIGDAQERLLEAALELFTRKGYAATAVREIVLAAGVTKPVLYYHFGNKEGLYLAIMRQNFSLFEETVAAIVDHEGTAPECLVAFCQALFDCLCANIPRARLIYAMHFGPPQGAPAFDITNFFNRMLEITRAMIGEGIAAGILAPVDPEALAWAMVGSLNTIMEEQLMPQPRIDRNQMTEVIRLILDGVTVKEKAS
jgi:AcrR family transcriptional regulator